MTYQTAFPDFELDVTIPDGFVDASWHNDAMPSWVKTFDDGRTLTLFVDYADSNLSEWRDCDNYVRFWLYAGDTDGMNDSPLISTNDYTDILSAIAQHGA